MIAVTVTFNIRDNKMAEFVPAMIENARASLANEEGCHRFDVCTDSDRPNEVFLYELYSNRTAFDDHLKSAHFKAFDRAAAALVKDKNVRIYETVAT